MTYMAPVEAIAFTLNEIAGLAEDVARGAAGDYTPDILASILEEAGRFASERLAPTNLVGDRIGVRLESGAVRLPDGWPEIYREWAAAGWNGVDLPAQRGGMGLPTRLATALMEIWTSANMSFAMGPVLTQGAADALLLHASRELQDIYVEKLISGDWSATMALTEPQAGSDLGALRTRAIPVGDGRYRISGNKIFISWGEHDFTDNIIHLVLARLPDAPTGTKGISLFVVPKFLVNPDGSLGARNDVRCVGLEHKLGIHASPTCSMIFGDDGGAVGWLVGEANRGLACMFTMMNKARLFTGLQGVALGELAYQKALVYAQDRRQGRAAHLLSTGKSPIIAHPDVRRNLATMRASVAAMRAIAYVAARAIDLAHASPEVGERQHNEDLAGLLTPVMKAWCSDTGFATASIGIQVHGGVGYVEETGAAQILRDARIPPIYEGTNGIQGIDLVLRKVLRPGSTIAHGTIAAFADIGKRAAVCSHLDVAEAGRLVIAAVAELRAATDWMFAQPKGSEALLFAATPYLNLWGVTAGATYLAKGAIAAHTAQGCGDHRGVLEMAIEDALFFAQNFGVMAPALRLQMSTRSPASFYSAAAPS
jgi:acyl-CoA dehydrogenase